MDEHVSALYAAREAFMRKDHESLKKKVRPYTGVKYVMVNKMY